jgi:hypothetical protein
VNCWQECFKKLQAFYLENGHSRVPHKDATLYKWCVYQKRAKRKGTLINAMVESLKGVEFSFQNLGYDADVSCWQESFKKLQAFYLENGHSRVPSKYASDRERRPPSSKVKSHTRVERQLLLT